MPKGVYVRSEEHKQKIREALTGLKRTDETKEKIRLAKLGNTAGFQKGHTTNVGTHRSDETKLKMSLKQLGENNSMFGVRLMGENSGNWKGGRTSDGHGYIKICKPDHPFAMCGYVYEHRLIMETFIGRYLLPTEIIHHINSVRNDNKIENLMLFSSDREHHKYHTEQRRLSKVS